MNIPSCGRLPFAAMVVFLSLFIFPAEKANSCTNGALVDFAVPVPPPDPESTTPPSPPSNLPSLVSAGTSGSASNLSATVVIEKHDQSEDTNQRFFVSPSCFQIFGNT